MAKVPHPRSSYFNRDRLGRFLRGEDIDDDLALKLERALTSFSNLHGREMEANWLAAGTRLMIVPSGEILGPEDIPVEGGVGITLRKRASDGALIFDAPAVAPAAPAGLYVPDVSTWPAITLGIPNPPIYLTFLAAYIAGTTPATGTDTSNHYALRAAGTLSGSQSVPLSTVGGREYEWSGSDQTSQGGQDTTGGGTPNGDAIFGADQRFEATADFTVDAIRVAIQSGDSTSGLPKRLDLTADDGTVLGTTGEFTDGIATDPGSTFSLESSVDLTQGKFYRVRWLPQDGHSFRPEMSLQADMVWVGNCADGGGCDFDRFGTGDDSTPEQTTRRLYFGLRGSPIGVLIDGDLEVSVQTVGTPPNVPTQVNTRLQWASEL